MTDVPRLSQDRKRARPKLPLPAGHAPLDRTRTYGSVRGVTLVFHSKWALHFNLAGVREFKSLGSSHDAAARRWLRITEGEIEQGRQLHELTIFGARPRGGLRFREAAAQYFAEKRQARTAVERTLWRWEQLLDRYVAPALGTRYMTAIAREDVKAVVLRCLNTVNRFGRPNTPGTAGAVLGAVRIVFAWLIAEGKLRGRDGHDLANPCAGLRRELLRDPVGADVRRRVKPFAPDAQARIVAFFRSGGVEGRVADANVIARATVARPAIRRWWLLVLLAFRAGLRIGELIALQLDDVDLEHRTVTVRRTWTPCLSRNDRGKPVAGIQEFPKGKRIRVVHLAQSVVSDLRRHIDERRAENGVHRWTAPWLFVNSAGRPTGGPQFSQHVWRPALAALGLEGRFHDTRATYATELLYATRDFAYVSRQLGHSQERTTALYTHVLEELEQHQVDLVDERRPLTKARGRAPAPTSPATAAGAKRPLAKAGTVPAGAARHLRVVPAQVRPRPDSRA